MLQVSPPDSGFYSCVAGNILGESTSTAYLEISPAPRPAPAPWLAATVTMVAITALRTLL